MKPCSFKLKQTSGAFTLVEVLVSVSILGLIMVAVGQMMASAMKATSGGYKHMDADTQARLVLDRMAYDIAKIVKRADVDYYFSKASGNDQMAFYSESGGYYDDGTSTTTSQQSNVSLVGYRINSNNQLERLSKGLVWNGVNNTAKAMVFNPVYSSLTSNSLTTNWPNIAGNGTDHDYQVIGDQVFRLEYCFLVQQATINNVYPSTSPNISSNGNTTKISDNPWGSGSSKPNGLQDVTAIVVSIALLDNQSRAIITDPTLLPNVASNYLVDDDSLTTPYVSNLPLPLWEAALSTALASGGDNMGLPKAAASQIRFYQRYCYLNHLQ